MMHHQQQSLQTVRHLLVVAVVISVITVPLLLTYTTTTTDAFVLQQYHSQHEHQLYMQQRVENDAIDGSIEDESTISDRKRRSTILFTIPTIMMLQSSSTMAVAVSSSSSSSNNNSKDLKEEYRQGTAALSDDDAMAPVPREAYVKLPSGLIYADVVKPKASTPVVQVGSKVNLQWVLRRSNGYFVDSSQVNDSIPFVYTVGDTSAAIVGLDEGIRGMSVGGVRRLLIPPSLAYVQGVNDGLPGPIPVGFGPRQQIRRIQNVRKDVPGEYIYLEVQLTRLR